MKNKFKTSLLFILCLILGQNTLLAQDSLLSKAFYTFKHIRDTSQKNNIYVENMVLEMGKYSSKYISFDQFAEIEKMRKQDDEQKALNGEHAISSISYKGVRQRNTSQILIDLNAKTIVSQQFLVSFFNISEPLPNINWEIIDENETFQNLNCQKAKTSFKGREWTVWFCADIPLSFGPWKLQGLPGLIVKAEDQKKEISFELSGYEKVVHQDNKVDLIQLNHRKAKLISSSDWKKLEKSFSENPKAILMSQLRANRGFPENSDYMILLNKSKEKNPIELSE